MQKMWDYNIIIQKDGKFYTGYCLEIPQAKGQGETRDEAIEDIKKAIILCRSYFEDKRKNHQLDLVTVTL